MKNGYPSVAEDLFALKPGTSTSKNFDITDYFDSQKGFLINDVNCDVKLPVFNYYIEEYSRSSRQKGYEDSIGFKDYPILHIYFLGANSKLIKPRKSKVEI